MVSPSPLGFPGSSDAKESTYNVGDLSLIPGLEWLPTPVSLPGGFHWERSLAGYSPWDRKEKDTTDWLTLSLFLLLYNFYLHVALNCSVSTLCESHTHHYLMTFSESFGSKSPERKSEWPTTYISLLQDKNSLQVQAVEDREVR